MLVVWKEGGFILGAAEGVEGAGQVTAKTASLELTIGTVASRSRLFQWGFCPLVRPGSSENATVERLASAGLSCVHSEIGTVRRKVYARVSAGPLASTKHSGPTILSRLHCGHCAASVLNHRDPDILQVLHGENPFFWWESFATWS